MAAPAIRATGTANSGTTGAVTYTLPTHDVDDILLLFVETGQTAGLTAPSGWSHITTSPRAQGTNVTCVNVYWLRASSASETNPQVIAAQNHQVGFAISVSGCVSTGNPWDFTPVGNGAATNTTFSAAGGTTTVDDTRIFMAIAGSADIGTDQFNTVANSTLSDEAEVFQAWTIDGNGGGIGVYSGTRATAGTTGTFTGNVTTTSTTSRITFALVPSTETPVSSTDTGSLAVSESVDVTVVENTTDTSSVSVSESSSISSTSDSTDTFGISVNESSTIEAFNSTTDTSTLAVADLSSILVLVSAEDTATLSSTENIILDSDTQRTDTASLSITENADTAVSLSSTDSMVLSVLESSQVSVSIVSEDDITLSASDVSETQNAFASTDESSLSVSDESSSHLAVNAVDSLVLNSSEESGTGISSESSDTAALSVSESSEVAKAIESNDTISLSIQEQSSIEIFNNVQSSDTIEFGVVETASIDGTVSTTDTTSMSVNEVVNAGLSTPGNETISIGVTETSQVSKTIDISDGTALSVSESTTLSIFNTLAASDDVVLSVLDDYEVFKELFTTDEMSLVISDSSDIVGNQPPVEINASDTFSIGLTDDSLSTLSILTFDTVVVSANEQEDQTHYISESDTMILQLSESPSIFSDTNVFDSLAFVLGETATTGTEINLLVFIDGTWQEGIPLVYKNHEWVPCKFAVFIDGAWQFA